MRDALGPVAMQRLREISVPPWRFNVGAVRRAVDDVGVRAREPDKEHLLRSIDERGDGRPAVRKAEVQVLDVPVVE